MKIAIQQDIYSKNILKKIIVIEVLVDLKIKNEELSANYLTDRLPKALEILKKQNKILFGKNFKEVNHIRSSI